MEPNIAQHKNEAECSVSNITLRDLLENNVVNEAAPDAYVHIFILFIVFFGNFT